MTSENSATPVESARFIFHPTRIAGVWRIVRKPIADFRGHFTRFFCAEEFAAIGANEALSQINTSYSKQAATLRGMHFQHPPHAEQKIVSCSRGAIFDVAVDVRRGSATFLQWTGIELNAGNQEGLLIPPGVAHGYQTLQNDAEIIYLVSTPYCATAEDGLNPFDPAIGIAWPLPPGDVSARDASRAALDLTQFRGIDLRAGRPPQ